MTVSVAIILTVIVAVTVTVTLRAAVPLVVSLMDLLNHGSSVDGSKIADIHLKIYLCTALHCTALHCTADKGR